MIEIQNRAPARQGVGTFRSFEFQICDLFWISIFVLRIWLRLRRIRSEGDQKPRSAASNATSGALLVCTISQVSPAGTPKWS